jgi:O-antigen/teichoic acid export membrane protein
MTAAVWEAITDVAAMALIARYLDVYLFGDYAFVMAFVAVFRVLCGISLPVILTREIAVHKDKAPQLLKAGLLIQGVTSVLTMLLVVIMINAIRKDAAVIQATYLAMLGIVFDFLSLLFVAVAKGYERMEYVAYRIVICQTMLFTLLLVLVKTETHGFMHIFVIFAASYFVGLIYSLYIVLKKFVRPAGPVDMKLCKYLFMEAYPIALRRFIRRVGFRIDTILLNFLRGNVETGLFHGAYKVMQGLMFVGESLVVSVFPVLSRHFVKAKGALDKLYDRSFRFLAVSGGFLGVLLFAFSRELIIVILGRKYLEAGIVLRVFSPVVVFMFLSKLAERMLIVGKKQMIVTLIAAAALIVNVTFDLALIPKMGIVGASLATLVAEIGLFWLGWYYTRRFVSDEPVHGSILKVLLVYSSTCCLVALSNAYMSRVVGFICGPVIYILGVFILGLVPASDLNEIKGRILKAIKLQVEHP